MIIFLYGENSFLSRRKLKELKQNFNQKVDPSGNSLVVIDGKKTNIQEINKNAGIKSLFSAKRMLVVEDVFLNSNRDIYKDVLQYLSKKEEGDNDNVIIFWDSAVKLNKQRKAVIVDSSKKEKFLLKAQNELFDFLNKQKYTQEFKAFSNTMTNDWIRKEVTSRGGNITYQAAQLLAGLTLNDLWQIDNEIDKLINYKKGVGDKLQIEIGDVEELTKGGFDENIFALTDAISGQNKKLVFKLFEEQIEAGLSDVYLLNMIIRQFKILLQVRQALDSGLDSRKIISLLKLHPFIVQKSLKQVENFTLLKLKNILNSLVEIDYLMKSGQADIKTNLSLLIAKN